MWLPVAASAAAALVAAMARGVPRTAAAVVAVAVAEAAAALAAYVEEMKASGFVAEALARHGIEGASVAPAAGS